MPEAPETSCPGEETLAIFAGGGLAAAAADALEAHLDGCADCAWLVSKLIGDAAAPGSSKGPVVPEVQATQPARYLLRAVAGSGGMGTVYEAEDVRLGRRVALKLLREEGSGRGRRVERFLREARITSLLEHPNIIPV